MPKYLSKKSIIPFILIVIIAVGIPIAVREVQKQQSLRSQALSSDLPPRRVAVSNIYSTGFTVSYVTNGATVGKVIYGVNQDNLDQIVEETTTSGLHHINIKGLISNTNYYFKICSGSDCTVNNQSSAYGLVPSETLENDNLMQGGIATLFTTPGNLSLSGVAPTQIFGEVNPTHLTSPAAANAIMVRAKVGDGITPGVGSSLISQVTSNPNMLFPWSLELANLRTSDLSSRYNVSQQSMVIYDFYTNDGYTKEYSQWVVNSQPLVPNLNSPLLIDEPIFTSPTPTLPPPSGGVAFDAGITADVVTQDWHAISFASPPQTVFATISTQDGGDPVAARVQRDPAGSFLVKVEEEKSLDDEVGHTNEKVSYIGVSNITGANSGQIVNSQGQVIGEVGIISQVIQVDENTWFPLQLQNAYSNPVVVMQIISNNDPDPAHIRLRYSIDPLDPTALSGFQYQIEEWDYQSPGDHGSEDIAYIVVEAGVHTLSSADGTSETIMVAGKSEVDNNYKSIDVGGGTPLQFTTAPSVISMSQTQNEGAAIVTRQNNILLTNGVGVSSFDVKIVEEEASDKIHINETVGYIAVSTSPTAPPPNTPTPTPTDVPTTPANTPTPTSTPVPTATGTSAPSIPGDINKDGIVNLSDYILLSNAFLTTDPDADLNNDGFVNLSDYIILSNNFGRTSP